MDHLACFAAGMLALDGSEEHLTLGKEIMETCYHFYSENPSGLGPEIAGFEVRKVTYINTFLFPVIFAALMLIKTKQSLMPVAVPDKTNISFSVPKLLNSVLSSIFCFESRILKNISFPIGHSLVCIVQKKK